MMMAKLSDETRGPRRGRRAAMVDRPRTMALSAWRGARPPQSERPGAAPADAFSVLAATGLALIIAPREFYDYGDLELP